MHVNIIITIIIIIIITDVFSLTRVCGGGSGGDSAKWNKKKK